MTEISDMWDFIVVMLICVYEEVIPRTKENVVCKWWTMGLDFSSSCTSDKYFQKHYMVGSLSDALIILLLACLEFPL